jgi:hypothetical protein
MVPFPLVKDRLGLVALVASLVDRGLADVGLAAAGV